MARWRTIKRYDRIPGMDKILRRTVCLLPSRGKTSGTDREAWGNAFIDVAVRFMKGC
jgi:hypothetical protein